MSNKTTKKTTLNMRQYGMMIMLVVVYVFFAILTKGKNLTPMNINNLIMQNGYVVILAVGLLLLYAAAALCRTMLEPRFMGSQMGLNPLLTLLCLYAGFRLFGVLGMILVPLAVILLKQLYDLLEAA